MFECDYCGGVHGAHKPDCFLTAARGAPRSGEFAGSNGTLSQIALLEARPATQPARLEETEDGTTESDRAEHALLWLPIPSRLIGGDIVPPKRRFLRSR